MHTKVSGYSVTQSTTKQKLKHNITLKQREMRGRGAVKTLQRERENEILMEADRRENCFQTQRQDANTMPSSSCQRHVKRMSANDQHRQGAGEKPHTEIINHLPCLSLLPPPYVSF